MEPYPTRHGEMETEFLTGWFDQTGRIRTMMEMGSKKKNISGGPMTKLSDPKGPI